MSWEDLTKSQAEWHDWAKSNQSVLDTLSKQGEPLPASAGSGGDDGGAVVEIIVGAVGAILAVIFGGS